MSESLQCPTYHVTSTWFVFVCCAASSNQQLFINMIRKCLFRRHRFGRSRILLRFWSLCRGSKTGDLGPAAGAEEPGTIGAHPEVRGWHRQAHEQSDCNSDSNLYSASVCMCFIFLWILFVLGTSHSTLKDMKEKYEQIAADLRTSAHDQKLGSEIDVHAVLFFMHHAFICYQLRIVSKATLINTNLETTLGKIRDVYSAGAVEGYVQEYLGTYELQMVRVAASFTPDLMKTICRQEATLRQLYKEAMKQSAPQPLHRSLCQDLVLNSPTLTEDPGQCDLGGSLQIRSGAQSCGCQEAAQGAKSEGSAEGRACRAQG